MRYSCEPLLLGLRQHRAHERAGIERAKLRVLDEPVFDAVESIAIGEYGRIEIGDRRARNERTGRQPYPKSFGIPGRTRVSIKNGRGGDHTIVIFRVSGCLDHSLTPTS